MQNFRNAYPNSLIALFFLFSSLLYKVGYAINCSPGNSTLTNLQQYQANSRFNTLETSTVIPAPKNPQGFALIAHGLNLRPSKMNDLVQTFSNNQIEVVRLSLAGHGDNYEAFKTVTAQNWQTEIQLAFCILQKNNPHNLPVYLLGFSLGGVLLTDFLLENPLPNTNIKHVFLLAPAITPHNITYLVKSLSWLPSLTIPSLAPKEFRMHTGTPVQAYLELFKIIENVKNLSQTNTNLAKYSASVFIDPEDELVSLKGLQEFIAQNKLLSWQLFELPRKTTLLNYHHLIIDKTSLADSDYQTIQNQITSQINDKL